MFLMPPTAEELKSRLEGRGTEDADTIKARLLRAVEESQGVENYDYIVINDVLEDCTDRIHGIICSEHCKASNNMDGINRFRDELTNMWKGDAQ